MFNTPQLLAGERFLLIALRNCFQPRRDYAGCKPQLDAALSLYFALLRSTASTFTELLQPTLKVRADCHPNFTSELQEMLNTTPQERCGYA